MYQKCWFVVNNEFNRLIMYKNLIFIIILFLGCKCVKNQTDNNISACKIDILNDSFFINSTVLHYHIGYQIKKIDLIIGPPYNKFKRKNFSYYFKDYGIGFNGYSNLSGSASVDNLILYFNDVKKYRSNRQDNVRPR